MTVSIGMASRLQFSELRVIDGVTFWDLVELPTFRSRPSDLFHKVESSDQIDDLARTYYGDEEFWWVIAWANDFEILPTDMNEGAEIIIPDPEYVRTELFPEVSGGS